MDRDFDPAARYRGGEPWTRRPSCASMIDPVIRILSFDSDAWQVEAGGTLRGVAWNQGSWHDAQNALRRER